MSKSTPLPSLESSNQAQISDLVQRNKLLTHTNQKLTASLASETTRSQSALLALQSTHTSLQSQWNTALLDVLASYRIVQKSLEVEVERERGKALREMEVSRKEKLMRLQRDYKIRLFIMREEELERRVESGEVRREVENRRWNELLTEIQDKSAELASRWKDTKEALARVRKEKAEKEEKLNHLRASHANLDATQETFSTKLTRTQLQLEGLQTKNAQLIDDLNDEKRKNADLSRQLEKWQTLESKEGADAESERKLRLKAERKLEEMKDKYENLEETSSVALEREKRRVEKMKNTTMQWQEAVESSNKELQQTTKRITALEKENKKLKDDLEVERARVRPPSPQKPKALSPDDDDPDDIYASDPEPPRKPSSKRSASTVKKPTEKKTLELPPEQRTARKSTGSRPPPRSKAKAKAPDAREDSDIEVIEDPDASQDEGDLTAARRKQKSKASAGTETETSDAPQKSSRKRKITDSASDEDEDEDEQPKPRSKRGTSVRAGSQTREAAPPARARSKPPSRAGSRQPSTAAGSKPRSRARKGEDELQTVEEGDEEGEGVDEGEAEHKKKKRKITLFPKNDKGAATILNSFGANTLDIPTFLSPVRQDEPVPLRSTASSSLVGSLASFAKRPFGAR